MYHILTYKTKFVSIIQNKFKSDLINHLKISMKIGHIISMKTKSKEVMKRNIKNDMERSIYLQMLPFQISSFVIFILFSLSHLNTLLAARISLISLFLLYCSQKKLFHFHCISSFKYLYGFCFRDIRSWRCWNAEQHSHCKISSLWHLLSGYLFVKSAS